MFDPRSCLQYSNKAALSQCSIAVDVRGMGGRLPSARTPTRPSNSPNLCLVRTLSGQGRLVLHEIDHLAGRLYTDRLMKGSLIPIEEYEGTYTAWQYLFGQTAAPRSPSQPEFGSQANGSGAHPSELGGWESGARMCAIPSQPRQNLAVALTACRRPGGERAVRRGRELGA